LEFKEVIIPDEEKESASSFTDYENSVNKKLCLRYEFADKRFCEDLCEQSTAHKNECKSLCESLIREENICPGDKKCPFGCPCPKFECKHYTHRKQIYWEEPILDLPDYPVFGEIMPNPESMNPKSPSIQREANICLAYQARVEYRGAYFDITTFLQNLEK